MGLEVVGVRDGSSEVVAEVGSSVLTNGAKVDTTGAGVFAIGAGVALMGASVGLLTISADVEGLGLNGLPTGVKSTNSEAVGGRPT